MCRGSSTADGTANQTVEAEVKEGAEMVLDLKR